MLPGQMSLNIFGIKLMVGSEFDVHTMKRLINPALYKQFRLLVV